MQRWVVRADPGRLLRGGEQKPPEVLLAQAECGAGVQIRKGRMCRELLVLDQTPHGQLTSLGR